MNVLMLNYEFPPIGGGAAPVTCDLSRELVALGHAVDVVTMHYRGTKRWEVVDGVRVFRVPALRRKREMCSTPEMLSYIASAFPMCGRLMRENRYDVLHSHFIFPTGVLAYLLKRKTGIPVIITAHGSDVPGYNPDRFRLLHRFLGFPWRAVVRSADLLVTPSEYLRDMIQKRLPVRVRVIPNGFRPGSLRPSTREKRILLVSRIFRRKGVQYFLDAIRDMPLDYEVVIAGDGPYLRKLQRQAENILPKVHFVGFVQDEQLKRLYETSSIFVFTSLNETFGVVLLEAMSAGLAIITTNVTGCPEVVRDAALLVDPKSPEQIRDALRTLIRNPQLIRELGDRGMARVKDFDWRRVAHLYVHAYRGVAA